MLRSVVLGFLLFCGTAYAEAADFIGNWKNPDPKRSGLIHVAISPNGGNRVDVRAYGDCHPMECDWGLVQGKVYYADPKSNEVVMIVATFNFGFAHHQITFKKAAKGQVAYEMATDFDDNSQRHSFVSGGILTSTTWVGPIGPMWQGEPGLQTGWGGGARSGMAATGLEECTVYDTRDVRAVKSRGIWRVMAAGKVLVTFGSDEKAAQLAEAAFRHYRFDRLCRIGGPWKPYWRPAKGFAADRMGGIYCLPFHSTTTHLVRSKNSWNIVDGATTLIELGPYKPQAEAMLGMIRQNRLTGECSIGSPDILTFWVSEPVR